MSLQTTVLRDGQWVTETVGLHTVLKSLAPKTSKKPKSIKAPTCGLLTRTVAETGLVHHILPVRLRSTHHNDVAFVGDHYVQIRELQPDGQLQDLLRRNDFGSRIRNATVIGSIPDNPQKDEKDGRTFSGVPIKSEDGDVVMDAADGSPSSSTHHPAALPPQMLVLLLECGDTVFLWIRPRQDGTPEFAHSSFPSPTSQLVSPGFHMAVDPSSRYLALGCAERSFVVYELDSLPSLGEQSRRGQPLVPVINHRLRSVQGVIQQMQFLYPRPEDAHHIILLLIIVRNGESRMVIYDWELGNSLRDALLDEKRGQKMDPGSRLPLLVVPLRVRSAFICISEQQIAVYSGVLHGDYQPDMIDIDGDTRAPTDNYQGRNKPLWTAWARPSRLSEFFRRNDCIYLAREDGVVYFMEADSDGTLTATVYIQTFDCSISTAFSCLYDQYDDVLVMGGDAGPGAIWRMGPREDPAQLGTLPNWSPVVDFATTDEFTTWNQEISGTGTRMIPWQDKKPSKPDRLFSTSGRGATGTITEYRCGLQAKIGLEYECDLGVKQAFLLPARLSDPAAGHDLLLSMPDQTTVLRISQQLDAISQPPESDDGSLKYDTSSMTLTALVTYGLIVQVTEQSITLINAGEVSRLAAIMFAGPGSANIVDATVCNEYIAVSTHSNSRFRLHILRIHNAVSLHAAVIRSFDVATEVTCVSLCRFEDKSVELLAGLWQQGQPILGRARVDGRFDPTEGSLELLMPYDYSQATSLESPSTAMDAIDSIVSSLHNGEQYTVIGLRSGEIITVVHSEGGIKRMAQGERLGGAAAKVTGANVTGSNPMVLITSDSQLTLMSDFDLHPSDRGSMTTTKQRVWPVDVSNPAAASPSVDSITVLPRGLLTNRDGTVPLLILSGARVLFAELQLQPGPAHRHIPVNGTPTKILYSHYLRSLVVAVSRNDQPTLVFLDPDTGEDIGAAVDKDDNICAFARGLGKPGDEIKSLAEWEYKRDGHTWHFLLVGMKYGRLMVMSAEKQRNPPAGAKPQIRYSVRFQKKGMDKPVYSVLGHGDSIIYCVGVKIVWEVMDPKEKRLRPLNSYELETPATSLSMINGRLVALTYNNSVEIIAHDGAGASDNETGSQLVHSDPKHRNTWHMIEVAGSPTNDPLSSLVMVSDWMCGVGGLWVPWQAPSRDCEVVFEADLPSSVRRFARGRTRPVWEQGVRKPAYGRIAMTVDDAEVLGVCMDGSLVQFQLLSLEVWRVLRFVVNLAELDEGITPFDRPSNEEMERFDPEPVPKPELMHVDGNVLERVVQRRALERLITKRAWMERFRELLDGIDEGRLTAEIAGAEDVEGSYLGIAYRVLKHFVASPL
ncbi:mono-functional DNA-alkylating methyl methanesulfonate N-term-domain-containing protein [Coniochaeta sp. 2T2.1]|nr:mono-functional DNA-alkylating methyl methanesulfonate N-term-domain-containing protein [Coniochaeta sp. 2T2.1]